MIKNLMDKLKEFKLPNGVIAIYLYGSFIKGRLREDSDIDIAVLTEHSMKSEERLILMSEIEALFSRIFSALGFSQNVNIIEMRSRYASIELLYDIVREGLCIYERSIEERIELENIIKSEYFDFYPFLKHLREKRYGKVVSKKT
jgi:predicted nucleotidyltransferase